MPRCEDSVYFFEIGDGSRRYVIGSVLALIGFTTVISNSLLFASFIKTKQITRNASNILIIFIAASDFLTGILVTPLFVYLVYKGNSVECSLRKRAFYAFAVFACISTLVTVQLAIDRYIHMNPNVRRPTRLAVIFKRPYLYILLLVTCTFAIISPALYLLPLEANTLRSICRISFAVVSITMVTLTTAMYLRGYMRIKRFIHSSPIYQSETGTITRPQYVQRLHKSILALNASLLIAYVPLGISNLILVIYSLFGFQQGLHLAIMFHQGVVPIFFSNRFVPPIIILWHNKEARSWLKRFVLNCKFLKSRTGNTTESPRPRDGTKSSTFIYVMD